MDALHSPKCLFKNTGSRNKWGEDFYDFLAISSCFHTFDFDSLYLENGEVAEWLKIAKNCLTLKIFCFYFGD